MNVDITVVGAGFAGSVVARQLAECGYVIEVVEKRDHIGGNAYDYYHESGLLVHKYGPHIFHTNDAGVVDYLSRFTSWTPYEHRVRAALGDTLYPMPINAQSLAMLYGTQNLSVGVEEFLQSIRVDIPHPRNAEESVLARMGQDLYEKFFRHYTQKQWGRDPRELDASVTARIPIRTNDDDRYFTDKFQMMPKDGYTKLFERMLDHRNILIRLQTPWEEVKHRGRGELVVFSGPIDAYYDHCFGRLPYRSLEFLLETHPVERLQPVGTINYPDKRPYTRVTEIKSITGQIHPHTVLITEFPKEEGEPYYPIPAQDTRALLGRYLELAQKTPDVTFVGRLGTYRYYNMDQVVAQALHLANTLRRNIRGKSESAR